MSHFKTDIHQAGNVVTITIRNMLAENCILEGYIAASLLCIEELGNIGRINSEETIRIMNESKLRPPVNGGADA